MQAIRHLPAGVRRWRRGPQTPLCMGLVLLLGACAQDPRSGDTPEDGEQLADALQNYETGAPMNGREIPNGPGVFSGSEGGFVIFRK